MCHDLVSDINIDSERCTKKRKTVDPDDFSVFPKCTYIGTRQPQLELGKFDKLVV